MGEIKSNTNMNIDSEDSSIIKEAFPHEAYEGLNQLQKEIVSNKPALASEAQVVQPKAEGSQKNERSSADQ
jgi:hypothetical protein